MQRNTIYFRINFHHQRTTNGSRFRRNFSFPVNYFTRKDDYPCNCHLQRHICRFLGDLVRVKSTTITLLLWLLSLVIPTKPAALLPIHHCLPRIVYLHFQNGCSVVRLLRDDRLHEYIVCPLHALFKVSQSMGFLCIFSEFSQLPLTTVLLSFSAALCFRKWNLICSSRPNRWSPFVGRMLSLTIYYLWEFPPICYRCPPRTRAEQSK